MLAVRFHTFNTDLDDNLTMHLSYAVSGGMLNSLTHSLTMHATQQLYLAMLLPLVYKPQR